MAKNTATSRKKLKTSSNHQDSANCLMSIVMGKGKSPKERTSESISGASTGKRPLSQFSGSDIEGNASSSVGEAESRSRGDPAEELMTYIESLLGIREVLKPLQSRWDS